MSYAESFQTSIIFCTKYKKDMPALDSAPFPGVEGEKILNNISEQAWNEWLGMQTMFINENQLNMMDSQARTFLTARRNEFLFEGGDFIDPPEPA